ncbi:MAG TPA: hypothetical protein VK745_24575 [Polyangiaceae bacterium]|jgi:hypothetical protein|nr:hypothetical protein [Polyangiaceae bacterium]
MRALSACLTAVLALGLGVAACSSSSSDDSAAAGAAGAPATGGAGGTSDIGAGGAPECSFTSDACTTCLAANCADALMACSNDDATCAPAVDALEPCLCNSTMTTAQCESTFKTSGGDLATALATCVDTSCMATCE